MRISQLGTCLLIYQDLIVFHLKQDLVFEDPVIDQQLLFFFFFRATNWIWFSFLSPGYHGYASNKDHGNIQSQWPATVKGYTLFAPCWFIFDDKNSGDNTVKIS